MLASVIFQFQTDTAHSIMKNYGHILMKQFDLTVFEELATPRGDA